MALDFASKVAGYMLGPIGREISYVINYESNVENLKEQVNQLTGARERVEHSVDAAKRNGDEIYHSVDMWLRSVTEITKEAEEFIVEDDKAMTRCLNGLCPNLKSRYQLSKKAKKIMDAVDKLRGEGDFTSVSYRVPLPAIWSSSIEGYMALESRKAALKEIMEALTSSNLSVIGVYGMGGVGKTTLVEQVARKAREDKLFNHVVMATVKETPDVENIQTTIADKLGLKFDEESQSGRADRLWHRLKDEEKILVILDNVCTALVLKEIGIPFGDDHEGCKILLTSRYHNVLSCEMGTHTEIRVEILPEEDALSLFEKMVGDGFKNATVQPVAIEVAKRCAGLPVLIVTVARALRNKSLYDWKDALKKLERFDNQEEMTEKVFSALELSYNQLKGKEAKSLFLLCGQLRLDSIPIHYLLRYSLGLGIFKNVSNLDEARNRVQKLVNDLKAACLLLEGESPGRVKMHDFVHDFALSIASRDHHVFSVDRNNELKEWPPKDKLEQCTAISFPFPRIHELPEELQCPKVESFFLFSRDPSLKIPENFFKGMKKLKVLELIKVHLLPLPLSLQYLENLRTLCLDYCVLGDIAALGDLKQLEILSLQGSNIVRLPTEIGKLTRLLLLDLSRCSKLEVISPGVLSSLSRLEELNMGNSSFVQWEIEESNSRRSNASLTELMNLPNLICLAIHIPDAKILPEEFFSKCKRLEMYHILIGDELDWSSMGRTSKIFKLKLLLSFHMVYGVKMFLKETEELHLHELKGVKNLLFELDGESFPLLKHLRVQNGPEILYIINSEGRPSCSAFPILESLILDKLINLEKICHGQLAVGSFAKLRSIKVESCHKLRYLFSISLASGLRQLQEIEVTECEIMEEIVAHRREDDANYNAAIEFTQIRSLTLKHLPRLTRFSSIAKMPSASQRGQKLLTSDTKSKEIVSEDELTTPTLLFNEKVVFPNLEFLKLFSIDIENIWDDQLRPTSFHFQNLTQLIVDGCGSLKYLFSISMVGSLVKLQYLEIWNCKLMERVIVTEEERMNKMRFPKLVRLRLKNLPKLTRFCSGNFIEFLTLDLMHVENCPDLKTFISNSICTDIMASEEHEEMNLHADQQAFFDDKVGLPNLKTLVIWSMNNVKKIWHDQLTSDSFCKLIDLNIHDCENLVNIFPSNVLERLQRLEHLIVTKCGSLEEIIEHQRTQVRKTHAAPQLRKLFLGTLPNLKHVWNEDIQEVLAFQNLHSIEVIDCQSLEHLFPAFVARGLLQLEVFEIKSCRMKAIVAKEKGVEAATSFVFPRVTSMKLWILPELKCFYPGIHTSEWSMLKKLVVYRCGNVECFASDTLNFKETYGESQHDIPIQQSLFLVGKVKFPNLEELRLEWNHNMKQIWHGQFSAVYFCKLKVLKLIGFPEKSTIFPSHFLQSLSNLEKFLVGDALFKEIFLCEGFTSEERLVATHIRLTELKLSKLPELMYLWKETFQPGPVFQNLQILEVLDCGKLNNLVPSSISFQNLTALIVSKCHRLLHLVTLSTAKSLVQLTKMSITECDMIEEIVAHKGEEAQDEIAFSRLKHMELHFLPRLTSFSSGNYTFEFPSLEKVIVRQCPKMKIFSVGNSSAPMLQGIQVAEDERRWEGNLNTAIQWLSTNMYGFRLSEYLNLSEDPEMQEIWPPQDPARFRHLRSLVVGKCAFLLNAIPSNLLQFLNNLEELDVRSCDLLEEIFDLEGLNADEGNLALLSKLSKFSLSDLPQLRHVWNEDSQRILGLKNLKVLKVHNCSSLRNVCALSLASSLVQLKEMEVKNCPMIEKIMTTEVEEAEMDKIVFPQLGSIILASLPNLTSFYSGTSMLECPSLYKITIIDCPNMKTFTTTSMREQEPKMASEGDEQRIGKGELDIAIAPFFNEKVVFPKLEDLIVDGCGSLKYLFSASMVGSPVKLLKIWNCKLMERVIVIEEEEGMIKMRFPKLKTLNLRNLPKLTRFCSGNFIEFPALDSMHVENCPDLKTFISNSLCTDIMASEEHEEMNFHADKQAFFDDKVIFPNLEDLMVDGCGSLKYLFSTSMVGSPVKLLKIWNCKLMERVIVTEEEGMIKMRFPKLKTLSLRNHPKLTRFCSGNFIEFPTLDLMHVENCPELKTFISNSICTDIMASEEHEEMNFHADKQAFFDDKVVFPNLEYLIVDGCGSLKYLFSTSMVGSPMKLLKIWNCKLMERVIVTEEEEGMIKMRFPKLETLNLQNLPELTRFCSGNFIEFPALDLMHVENCPDLKTFISNSLCTDIMASEEHEEMNFHADKQAFFDDKVVFPNLEDLMVDGCGSLKYLFSTSMVGSLVKLQELQIWNCKLMERVIVIEEEEEGMIKMRFPKLETLNLQNLPKLTSFCSRNFIEFPTLDSMHVKNYPDFKTFISNSICTSIMASEEHEEMDLHADKQAFFDDKVVFPNLEDLMVDGCGSLKYLFSTSMVGSLVKLQELQIWNCNLMERVIVTEEEEGMVKMRFPKLETLDLQNLPKLTSFCSGNFIEFPTLDSMYVENCPDLKTFISNSICTDIVVSKEHEEMKPEQNLDADKQAFFDDKVGLPGLMALRIYHMKNVKKIWQDQLASHSFCVLHTLVIRDCEYLVNIFPSNMLERLHRLVELRVVNCGSLEELFEHQGPRVRKTQAVAAPELRELYLGNLPNLKHVWNEDIQEILAFENLRSIEVTDCQSLEHLFPAFVARGLLQLEVFEITSCRIKEIVAKEKGVEAATSFVFPRVTSMKLWKVLELKCLYPGIHTSEWPMLKKLVVYSCGNVECFASDSLSFKETYVESQHDIPVQQSLFLVGKVAFPNLKELRLEWNDNMKEIWHGQFSAEYFCKLKVLELIRFPKEFANFPSSFLKVLPNLEKLVVINAFFKEIFPSERIYDEEEQAGTTLARLTELKLSELPELMHLWKEGVQGGPAFEILGTLEVSKCDNLKILVPSSISFQNLTILEVSKCHRLINLVTLSTARSLVQLSRMILTECELMTEAIANDGSEARDEIAFNQLKYLGLYCLPSLTSFCSGSYTLEFPSLEEVIVNQCSKLHIFSQGILSTPKLQRVLLKEEGDKEHWEGNLNSTIQHLFNKMNVMISEED